MKIVKVRNVNTPTYSIGNAGYDLYVPNDIEHIIVKPNECIKIPSGLRFDIPKGKVLLCHNRSSVSTKNGLVVVAEVIDECYTGECHLCLFNYSNKTQIIKSGQKLIQVVLMDYYLPELEIVEDIEKQTKRGNKGFGSSG